MEVLLRGVESAKVSTEVEGQDKVSGEIGKGYVLDVSFVETDTKEKVADAAKFITELPLMFDEKGRLSRTVVEEQAGILVISAITLCMNIQRREGKKAKFDFNGGAERGLAEELFNYFVSQLSLYVANVQTGVFGGDQKEEATMRGPVIKNFKF